MQRPITTLIVLLLLATGVQAGAGGTTSPPPGPDRVGDLVDPIVIQLAGWKETKGVLSLDVTLESTWEDLSDVTVDAHGDGLVVLSADALAPFPLARGESRPLTLLATPTAPGRHEVEILARGLSSQGALGGYLRLYVVTAEGAPAQVHVGFIPEPADAGRMVPIPRDLPVEEMSLPAPPNATQVREYPSLVPGGLPYVPVASGARSGAGAESATHFQFTGCMFYETESGSLARARYMHVQVYTEAGTFLWNGLAGGDGCFTSGLIPRASPNRFTIKYTTDIGPVKVVDSAGTPYLWSSGPWFVPTTTHVYNVGDLWPSSNTFAPRVFKYVLDGWDFAKNWLDFEAGGWTLEQVRVIMSASDCTHYTRSDKTIHLCINGVDDKSPDDVNHEYGHHVQWLLYNPHWPPRINSDHSFCQVLTGEAGKAWTEGFADWFGPAANRAVVSSTDTFYKRPWNGNLFSQNMESPNCSTQGDLVELRVAGALWDLYDSDNDGLDNGIAEAGWKIKNVVRDCDNANFREFYDATWPCSWTSAGFSKLNLMLVDYHNTIDYNSGPTATVTSQTGFFWAKGTVTLSATSSDPEGQAVQRVQFGLSAWSDCSNNVFSAGEDTTSPYSVAFNTANYGDTRDVYTCARGYDSLEWGPYAASARWGIDAAVPTGTTSAPATGAATGFTVSWSTSDFTSGVQSVVLQEKQQTASTWNDVCTSGNAVSSCNRNPSGVTTYCYRSRVTDFANNQFITAESCTLNLG